MSDPMIVLDHITKLYEHTAAASDVNLEIGRGELMTLLGPSGCGKTTTLRCITGHLAPEQGRVFINGRDVTRVPTYKRNLGMVFQNFALFPHMTVGENVAFPLKVRNVSRSERAERVREALRLVRLEGYEDRRPRQLSGGQQQRVGLARAVVYNPTVLLLDEPLSNLDAKLREEMRFEIRELQQRMGISAVYVTHDQDEALALSDRVAVMHTGRIQQVGTPTEIYEKPASPFVAGFIGLSNFIRGTLRSLGPGDAVIVAAHGLEIAGTATGEVEAGSPVLIIVRPNHVVLGGDGVQGANAFDSVVEKATYLGDKMDYRLALDGGLQLRAQADGLVRYQEGHQVRVCLPPERCTVVPDDSAAP